MDRERVWEQDHPQVPPHLCNVDPSADPAIPLHGFGHGPLDRLHDPLVPDRGAIGSGPSVREVVGNVEDTNSPLSDVTQRSAAGPDNNAAGERSEPVAIL